jgi:dTDP-4-dehydrorhamnose reductase
MVQKMIALIGHGYVAKHIACELEAQKINYTWITHRDDIPQCSAIINAAGYTGSPNVDACETHKQETINGNVIWPVELERRNPNKPIVHISSGCVYSGYDKEYTEDDVPNFDFGNGSFYSGSKALGQKMLEPFLHKSYLLRIRMPFGDYEDPKNFLTKMKRYPKLISYDNSLSYMPDVARVAVACALGQIKAKGIYNVCNPGSSNAREIVSMMGMDKEFFTEEAFKQAVVAPRSNCVLRTNKLQSVFPIQDVKTALTIAIGNLK